MWLQDKDGTIKTKEQETVCTAIVAWSCVHPLTPDNALIQTTTRAGQAQFKDIQQLSFKLTPKFKDMFDKSRLHVSSIA